jgi:hypothetical protein
VYARRPLCMSVKREPSMRFSSVVVTRLPRKRYIGMPPPRGSPSPAKRDPNVMSACPARIGAIRSGTAFGSYW